MSENHQGSRSSAAEGLEKDASSGIPSTALKGKRALILVEDPDVFALLHEHLFSLGVDCHEANCLAGASALLRREESMETPADFLFADEQMGGLCGMSLCSALLLPLRKRPSVLLATKGTPSEICAQPKRQFVDAMFDFRTPSAELGVLLTRLIN
jgi:CheY-like chemotaxis protein